MARSPPRDVQHRLTAPVRRAPVPVLSGNGRGLRMRFGESSLGRVLDAASRRPKRYSWTTRTRAM